MATRAERPGPGGEAALVGALERGIDLYRLLAWTYAAFLAWTSRSAMERPAVAAVVVVVLLVWTLGAFRHRARPPLGLATETAIACAGVLATPVAYGAANTAGIGTLPALWAAAPVMGWAVAFGARGGLLATAAIGVADLLETVRPDDGTIYNIVTLALVGSCLGTCAGIARKGQRALTEALRVQAETAERERLARTIHDGVLQALTFIHRRGEQLGGEAAHLGQLAADQERELRALALGPVRRAGAESVDIRAALTRLGGPTTTVSAPGDSVVVAANRAEELVAAIEAALANVRAHAGESAKAWVLLEDLGDTVVVTVRDDGVGYAPERLDEAQAAGRLGVSLSIDGRVHDLGGSVRHCSTPGWGTTVEMTIPKTAPTAHRPQETS